MINRKAVITPTILEIVDAAFNSVGTNDKNNPIINSKKAKNKDLIKKFFLLIFLV